jgi:hypothetical protein
MRRNNPYFILITILFLTLPSLLMAVQYPYNGSVIHKVKRDRIMAIAEDYATLYYYVGPDNITGCSGSTCPDSVIGWKTGVKYCWGGQDTTKIYLIRLTEGDVAGNKWCSSPAGTSEDTCSAGVDCSGFVSNAWTSPRESTSYFYVISDNILWEQLRMGDAMNNAGSHIRLFDYFISEVGTTIQYESCGTFWKCVHRSLARDDNYLPIRYNYSSSCMVYNYSEPVVTYIRKTGIERVEVRWDGEADRGFRLYQSTDATNWTLIRNADQVTSLTRTCEVSGLLPDTTYFFKMTALNSGNVETINSAVVPYRNDGFTPRIILVDGADRYREQKSANHTFLTRVGAALASRGLGFDTCANEAVVDEQVSLGDYDAAVWVLAEETTFDETFSWAEQMHVTNFLKGGGRLFVSGSEIAWDLDYKANDDTTYKNGSSNDRPFYNKYLRASYVSDDAGTYHVLGAAGSIFNGLDFYFDNGTHGTYDVVYPDTINPYGGATIGLKYEGGANACVYASSPTSGTVVNMGFPFETIYPDSARLNIMKAILNYFDLPVVAPTMKSVLRSGADSLAITWTGHAQSGFRLFQKTGSGSWTLIRDESSLGTDAQSATITGLSSHTRYAFKIQAVNSGGASPDSDVMVCSLPQNELSDKILIVDGDDRYNTTHSGANHTLLENFADALANYRYDSCTNECIADGSVLITDYAIIMWMCGEESTESETFSKTEQLKVQDFLKNGGRLFVSGAEIGWDLVHEADTNNNYSNGDPNDTPFYENYLKASFVNDDANTHQVRGVGGTPFAGLNFFFDDGTHGTYNVNYPDVIATKGGSAAVLYYGASGTNVAGVMFTGTVTGGSAQAKIINFGFPFETIYDATTRRNVMMDVLNYFATTEVKDWSEYISR